MDFSIIYRHVRPNDKAELRYFIACANEASHKGKKLELPFCQKNLRYDADGLYSYGTRIADIDLTHRTITKIGSYGKTSTRHYNRTVKYLKEMFDFIEGM